MNNVCALLLRNILVKSHQIKLIDFSMSKLISNKDEQTAKQFDCLVNVIPEIFNKENFSLRSDI